MAEVGLKLEMGLGESEEEGSRATGQRERQRVSPACRELPATCRSWRRLLCPFPSPPPSRQLFVCPAFFIINFCFKAPVALTCEMCPSNLPKAYQIKNSIMKRKYPKKVAWPKNNLFILRLELLKFISVEFFVYQFRPKPLATDS